MTTSSTITGAYWGNGVAFMLTGGQEGLPLEINGGGDIWTVAFAANGEYIVGSGSDGLGVWRVEDGKRMATMAAGDVNCLAVSKDGRWIAGDANVWDAKTFEKVFTHRPREEEDLDDILAVDFSPDSTRLVALKNQIATVWDIAARNKVLTLHSKGWMRAAKYSSQGDRIATATRESVRVWDSNDGHLLVDIPVKVSPLFNTGLIWSNNHLFVVSDSTITQLEASTGSTVSKLSVADTNDISSIALPKHGEFIAYSTIDTVTFWDPSTHAQLGLIQHPQTIHSIAHSPDDRFLAIVGLGGKITIRSLSRITVSVVLLQVLVVLNNSLVPLLFPNWIQSHYPVYITPSRNLSFRSTTLRSIHGSTISSTTRTRYSPQRSSNLRIQTIIYSLVELSSELVRDSGTQRSSTPKRCSLHCSHIHEADLNLHKAIKIQPSVIGYIAKSVALVGNGERHEGYRTCDIAFGRFHSSHVTFLLLVKVCTFPAYFPLSCSYLVGYHRVYGWAASRCDITRRRPHRYGPLQLNLLYSSGTCKRSATRRISPLTFPAGIYVSSPWKLAHGAQRLRRCDTIVRACTSPNPTLLGRTALGDLIGKFPNGCIVTYRSCSPTLTDIRMEL